MVQFDLKRKTLPGLDILPFILVETSEIRKDGRKAAAWLSSARSVRSTLKWVNERNPHPLLNIQRELPL